MAIGVGGVCSGSMRWELYSEKGAKMKPVPMARGMPTVEEEKGMRWSEMKVWWARTRTQQSSAYNALSDTCGKWGRGNIWKWWHVTGCRALLLIFWLFFLFR